MRERERTMCTHLLTHAHKVRTNAPTVAEPPPWQALVKPIAAVACGNSGSVALSGAQRLARKRGVRAADNLSAISQSVSWLVGWLVGWFSRFVGQLVS